MDIKTKAFLRELSHLLCRYGAEISAVSWYDGATEVNISIGKDVAHTSYNDITWQEIDLALEEDQ
jgi:hypothetical protein